MRVAEANDRLLIDLPGWRVSRADEFTVEAGEMTFTDGSHEVDLEAQPAGQYADVLADRAQWLAARSDHHARPSSDDVPVRRQY